MRHLAACQAATAFISLWLIVQPGSAFFCCWKKGPRLPTARSTPFPYITLAPGATFPPTAATATATVGPNSPLVFSTPPTIAATASTATTFPTLPTFPTTGTTVATTPNNCPPNLTLCPPTVATATAAPPLPNGFGILANGCPCFDPRSSQALTMIIGAITRGDFNDMLNGG